MPSTVYKGCEGEDVALCQERLNVWNYVCDVDGYFGRNTETAVMEFQSDHALVPDGIVGNATWNVLLSAPGGSVIPAPPYNALSTSLLTEIAWYIGWDYTDFKQAGAVALVARPSRVAPSNVVWAPGKKTKTVCSVFLGGIVGCVYDKVAKWTPDAWKHIQVQSADHPWSMIDELVAAGVGIEHIDAPLANKWYAAQAWTGLVNGKIVAASRGHQFFLWGPDLIAEATTYTDEDANGASDDAGQVAWRHRTWDKTKSRYDQVRLVALNG
jgi:hypothetical protein